MDFKCWVKVGWEIGNLYSLKVSPHKILFQYRGEESHFTGGKSGRWHPVKWWKFTLPVRERHWNRTPPDRITTGGGGSSVVSLLNGRNLTLIIRKYQTNPEWGTVYRTGLKSSKLSRSWKSGTVWGILGWNRLMRYENSVQCDILDWIFLLKWTLLGPLEKVTSALWIRWLYCTNVNFWVWMVVILAVLEENALVLEIYSLDSVGVIGHQIGSLLSGSSGK